MIYHGHGVSLGPIDRKHLELMRTWRNNPKIWAWCRQNTLITDLAQEQWYARQSNDPTVRMFMINDERGQPAGVCGFTSIDWVNRRAEFSLYIGPEKHGNGFGKLGLQTLLAYGFKTMGLNCIWGETFDGNPAAKTFEEVGMKKEGTRREFYYRDGRFIGCHLYSILASEWSARVRPRVSQGVEAPAAGRRDSFLANEGREPNPSLWTVPVQTPARTKKAHRPGRRQGVPKRA